MPGKGYSITDNNSAITLNIPAILCEARVAITPMDGLIRYGGTMEIASINHYVNIKRVEGILEAVPKYFSNLQPKMPDTKDIWYGFRPCSPDGLPFIGSVKKIRNLMIAGGHSMMGLGLGPATGKVFLKSAISSQHLSGRMPLTPKDLSNGSMAFFFNSFLKRMPSSVIHHFIYDEANRELRVFFISGIAYDYINVPKDLYDKLRNAISKGKFLNKNIKGKLCV